MYIRPPGRIDMFQEKQDNGLRKLRRTNMDFKVNREVIGMNESLYDGSQEQSVELDYVLPDYYPDIFKLIKCLVTPQIVSSSVSGDKASYELTAQIKLLYCAENSGAIQCVDQKMNYTKTVDFGRMCGEPPAVSILPKVDYINCRVVNSRRIDLRGALSVKVRASGRQQQQAVSDAFGMNIQLKKQPVTLSSSRLYASKRVDITEDFDLGYSKPAVASILRCDAVVTAMDKKVISNKLVVKGETAVSLLYTCQKDGQDSVETMRFTLPFSQILDMEGVDEQYECMAEVCVTGCDMTARDNEDGENKLLECVLSLLVSCTALKSVTAEIVTDAYSTRYPLEFTAADARLEKLPRQLSDTSMVKSTLSYTEEGLDCVYDAWCGVQNVTAKVNSGVGQIEVQGNLSSSVIAKNTAGMPVLLEITEPFQCTLPAGTLEDQAAFEPSVTVPSVSYSLVSTNTVEVKAELRISGILTETLSCRILTDIVPDDSQEKPREGDYALKLYFADPGEDVWEIAKRYSTSVDAVLEENDLPGETIEKREMLLIPIVG